MFQFQFASILFLFALKYVPTRAGNLKSSPTCKVLDITRPVLTNPLVHLNPKDTLHLEPLKYVLDEKPLKNIVRKKSSTTNQFLELEDMKYYNYYSASAECLLSNGPLNETAMVTMQLCCPCKSIMEDLDCYQPMENRITGTFALLTVSETRGEIVLAFSGTRMAYNVFHDTDVIQVPLTGGNVKGMRVHEGFLEATNSLYTRVLATLEEAIEESNITKVVFSGHSLGAAMAAITVAQMKLRKERVMDLIEEYSLVTYGMPRVGNGVFANFMNNLGVEVTRVVANADFVPHLPPMGNFQFDEDFYVHFHPELWINGDKNVYCDTESYEDDKCSNSRSPFYNVQDHVFYWNVTYAVCVDTKSSGKIEQCGLKEDHI